MPSGELGTSIFTEVMKKHPSEGSDSNTEKLVDKLMEVITTASQVLEERMGGMSREIGNEVESRLVSRLKPIIQSVVKEEMDNWFASFETQHYKDDQIPDR